MKSLSKACKFLVRLSRNFSLCAGQEQKLEKGVRRGNFSVPPPFQYQMPTGKEARETGIGWHSERLKGDKKLQIGCARGVITLLHSYVITRFHY